MKKLFCIGLFLFLFFIPSTVFAENEFSTSYNTSYDVGPDGITDVANKITLKNLTSKFYASDFTLIIGSTTVSDVSATDEGGSMETKVDKKANNTIINLKLNQQVAGIDKTQIFTLKYKSKDFADNFGKVWEVNLPKIPEGSNIEGYNLVLSVPISFGDPTFIVPTPRSDKQSFDRLFYNFDKGQLLQSGVSVSFGANQIFDFNLKYNLKNDSLFPIISSITLPPDTNYQDILISKIVPEPLNVTIDSDGNYLAWYRLSRKSSIIVNVIGSSKLYISPKNKKITLLSSGQIKEFTKNDMYWDKDNPAISAVLSEIFKGGTPEKKQEKTRFIYRYVVTHLKYDNSRLNGNLERLGAVTALNNPNSAICMEFTDLFIALARAAGIPAREMDGFGYSRNQSLRPSSLSKDLLHAWPEYFDDEKGWIMVDPTWENTSGGVDYFNKFDLSHIVFAIRGYSSKQAYIADSVNVTVSPNDFLGKPQPEADFNIPNTLWSPLPQSGTIKITNQGNSIQPSSNLSISSGKLLIMGSPSVTLGAIPPFGSTTYQITLRTPDLWNSYEDTIEINIGGQKFTKHIFVRSIFSFLPIPYLLGGAVLAIVAIYGGVLAFHIYQKRSSKKSK